MRRRDFLKKLIVACAGIPAVITAIQSENNECLLHGYRSEDCMRAGYFYAPYIPLYVSPVLSTSELVSRKGLLVEGEA